jgi:hypothetical protein
MHTSTQTAYSLVTAITDTLIIHSLYTHLLCSRMGLQHPHQGVVWPSTISLCMRPLHPSPTPRPNITTAATVLWWTMRRSFVIGITQGSVFLTRIFLAKHLSDGSIVKRRSRSGCHTQRLSLPTRLTASCRSIWTGLSIPSRMGPYRTAVSFRWRIWHGAVSGDMSLVVGILAVLP